MIYGHSLALLDNFRHSSLLCVVWHSISCIAFDIFVPFWGGLVSACMALEGLAVEDPAWEAYDFVFSDIPQILGIRAILKATCWKTGTRQS